MEPAAEPDDRLLWGLFLSGVALILLGFVL
jgi:hypothetical protein